MEQPSAAETIEPTEVEVALRARDFARIRRIFSERLPKDVAEAIEELDEQDRALLFRVLPRDQAAETFEYLSPEAQEGLIRGLAREQVASILNEMSPDDRTGLLEELPAAVTRQALAMLSTEERKVARRLLGYPEDSIGRLMTPDFIAMLPQWSVRTALEHVRRYGSDSETLNVIYVVDETGKLIDDLRMRQLLLADPDSHIGDLMDGQFVALSAREDQENAVRVFAEYDRVAFPVTDSKGMLLGIVTVDDVLDVIEEETTEDIHKFGGLEALEQPYMQVRFLDMLRKRGVWLVGLFCAQLLTLNAMGFFSRQIEQAIALVLFVPLIISSGGNSGSQAATLVVRAMALEEVNLGDWWRVLRREVLFGVILGALLATIGFLRILIGNRLGEPLGADWAWLGIGVGLSLTAVVLWGVLIGSMLPFALRRCGVDPAASSAPFVATIVDVTGLIIYFTVATSLLS